jgi:hypothetical protein
LEFIKNSEKYSDFDYLYVLDLDLNGNLFLDGIFHSMYHFERDSSISAISCNGLVKYGKDGFNYYDSFAYIEYGEKYEWETDFDKRSHDEEVLRYVTEKYTKNMDLDRVYSAFGGLCIYDLSEILESNAEYDYSKNNKLSCEHTHFHKKLKNIYVNPRMMFLINYV